MTASTVAARIVARLARLSPVDAPRSADLDQALGFVGSDLASDQLAEAAVSVLVSSLLVAGAASVLGPGVLAVELPAVLVLLGAAAAYIIYGFPRWLADARRARSLGDAPSLVARAALRMRVTPTPEVAAAFAAAYGDDPLSSSLDDHVRRARGGPRSGWDGFAREWDAWNPTLRRAVSLLRAAADAPPVDRRRLLDRALRVVLDGTHEQMTAFAESMRGPVSGLYAFGVVLPLALVAVVPAASAAGAMVTLPLVVAIYDGVLPCGLLAASAWLLARRPSVFPPVAIPRSHPDVPDTSGLDVGCGLASGAAVWVVVPAVLPGWIRVVSAPGCALGAALVCRFRPVTSVRDRTRAVEGGLSDALALVGQQLREGEAVEAAVARTAASLPDATGDVFADAARVQRQLRVGTRTAFLGQYGALREVPSPRVRASVELLALAAREGPHGGRVLVEVADHLDDLLGVERDARRELAQVTGTLRSTALLFAPLVGGATVALADRMGRAGLTGAGSSLGAAGFHPATGAGLSTAPLGIAVGAYVLALAAILTALAVGLDRGLDRATLGYHVGLALLSASLVYPVALLGTGLLV